MEWFLIWVLCGIASVIFFRSSSMPMQQDDGTVLDRHVREYLHDTTWKWFYISMFIGGVISVLFNTALVVFLYFATDERVDIFPIRLFTPTWLNGIKKEDGTVVPADEWMAEYNSYRDEQRQIRWHTLGKKMATIKKHLDDPNFKFFTW